MTMPTCMDLTTLDPRQLNGEPFIIRNDGFPYACRFMPDPESRLLFVVLIGAVRQDAPAYARWNWQAFLKGNILLVCDPTIYSGGQAGVSWYHAGREQDAIPVIFRTRTLLESAI